MLEASPQLPPPLTLTVDRMPLRAGPLTMEFDGDGLRTIRLGEREVIRRIYAAVRDRNWGTVPGEISELRTSVAPDSFRISYSSTHRQGEVHFVWRGEIRGESDGTIRFSFDGEAQTTFLRNRIGFCVLHPAECAGRRCRVRRASGPAAEVEFPRWVEPAQPVPGFHDLSTLAHEVAPDIWAELEFEGERFEMEDQRNWIDASFKTFCTPLHLAYPVEVPAMTRIRQSVVLTLSARRALPPDPVPSQAPVRIVLTAARRPVPAIGLGCASHRQPTTERERARLRGLGLSHLRADVRLTQPDWEEALRSAQADAASLEVPLELAVHLPPPDDPREIDALVRCLESAPATLARILLFSAGEKVASRAAVAPARPRLAVLGVRIGAGTDADFYQLNQHRPPHEFADFIHWSMNPQVHAFDLTSIAETPTAVPAQLESARAYFPGKPLVVSPITLKPRFNAVATAGEKSAAPDELPPQVDVRQLSPFAAAWTLAMLKQLAEGGTASVTFFETTGWRGVMERDAGTLRRERFPSQPGQVFPLYYPLAALGAFAGGEVLITRSSDPFRIEALALTRAGMTCVWLANLTATPQLATLTGFTRATRRLDLDWSLQSCWMFEPERLLRSEEQELTPAATQTIDVEVPAFGLTRLQLEP